jgi:hypothetical protein
MITGRASGGLSAGKETTEATKAANAYCAKQPKQMVLQNLNKTGNAACLVKMSLVSRTRVALRTNRRATPSLAALRAPQTLQHIN